MHHIEQKKLKRNCEIRPRSCSKPRNILKNWRERIANWSNYCRNKTQAAKLSWRLTMTRRRNRYHRYYKEWRKLIERRFWLLILDGIWGHNRNNRYKFEWDLIRFKSQSHTQPRTTTVIVCRPTQTNEQCAPCQVRSLLLQPRISVAFYF